MKSILWMCLVVGFCLAAPAGAAGTKTRSVTVVAPEAAERWNALLSVPRLDPRLGTLRSVTLRLDARAGGTARFENLNRAPLTLMQTLCVLFELRRPNFSTLLQGLPIAHVSQTVAGYDGVTDFGGTSGRTRSDLAAAGVTELVVTNPNDLLLFTGSGAVDLPLLVRPKPTALGAGDYSQTFSTRSRAELTVLYTYESAPVAAGPMSWSGIKLIYR